MDIQFTRKFGCQEQEKSCLWRKNLVIHKTRHAVALVKDEIIVGYVPRELSRCR